MSFSLLSSNAGRSSSSSMMIRSLVGRSNKMMSRSTRPLPLPMMTITPQPQQPIRYMGHSVRIIVREDLPNGKAYAGDVLDVKAGYARNFLIPQKMAVYATRHNFQKLGIVDDDNDRDQDTAAQTTKKALSSSSTDDRDLKAADLLKNYLKNKTLKIWRNVSDDSVTLTPGMVDAKAVRKKLSKQLMIDLEEGEKVHLKPDPIAMMMRSSSTSDSSTTPPSADDEEIGGSSALVDAGEGRDENDMEYIMKREFSNVNVNEPCTTEIKQLGEFLARLTIKGGYEVPLRVEVLKR